jgi:hypothetical protein
MDRVGEITRHINNDWTELNDLLLLQALKLNSDDLKDLHKRFDILRCEFANLISLGQEETWTFFAESNGVHLPEDDEDSSDVP